MLLPLRPFPCGRKPAIRGHEAGKHGGDEAGGLKVLSGLLAQDSRVVAKVSLTGLSSWIGPSFSFVISLLPKARGPGRG
jgi:hypothetical protein